MDHAVVILLTKWFLAWYSLQIEILTDATLAPLSIL